MGPPRGIDSTTNNSMSEHSNHGATSPFGYDKNALQESIKHLAPIFINDHIGIRHILMSEAPLAP